MKKTLSIILFALMLFFAALPVSAFAEEEEPHVHSLVSVGEVPSTCIAEGTAAHYACTGCDKLFSDENAEHEVLPEELVISKTGHTVVFAEETYSTCKTEGMAEHYVCSVCKKVFSDENGENEINPDDLILPLGKHTLIFVKAVPETCTKNGYNAYYKCTVCNKLFKNETAEKETTLANETVIRHDHTIAFKEGRERTFTKDGITEGAYCSECNAVLVPQKTLKKYGVPKLTKLKRARKKITAVWKDVDGIDGYVIQVSLKKNFKKNKTVTVTNGEITKKTVGSLKKKKKYYVRVRAYKKIDGERKYSKWSNVKSIKTK